MQKYPYGGHVKFSQYLSPSICCLIALGAVEKQSKHGIATVSSHVGH